MASDNETAVEAIAAERHRIECAKADAEDLEIECEFTDEEVVAIIDRIESAHKREIEELRECLKETINAAADAMWWKRGCDKTRNVCTNCGEKDKTFPCPVKRWRKALEGAKDEGK